MFFLLWLLVLGWISYYLLQSSISRITRTPVWLLWLVMMAPPLIWSGWVLANGAKKTAPPELVIIPFLVCPVLYWFLVQLGRKEITRSTSEQVTDSDTEPAKPQPPLRPIDSAEEASLRDCFPWSTYFLRDLEFRPQAVICRGQLRTNPEAAYQTIRENVEQHFGDRFLVIFQNSLSGQPFFALVPNPNRQSAKNQVNTSPVTRPFFALALLLIAGFTTTIVGSQIAGVTEKILQANPSMLFQGLPYSLALITILAFHESGHYLAARFYKIRTTLPYFIPIPFFLGTLGAFIQMRSPIPHRRALFDISIAGPFAGLVATVPLLIWGLARSTVVPLSDKSGMLNFDSFTPNFSVLMTLLSKLTLGGALNAETAINLHPVAVAGYLGLIVTAFNLMPVGQFDGGHIVHAMFGQRASMAIGQVARVCMLLLAFLEQGLLLWAIILFLTPLNNEPALNDVSELDNRRDFLGLLAIGLLLIILLPAPKILVQWLNI
ncbi:site-2 protease family protein [Microcoleus sp. LEGE 07076]|uniref:site-2 protease family protein n=1 Tax=Microcoleus sp. LEGE 07076 TaxID=915322 RepID=UPI00187F1A1E|nr:site-2 protease family protein [Microcoleus sp. LEGE 07076]MBE9185758.1 site-2 protease family protein [Microcoleus sp. LEGE 07076]